MPELPDVEVRKKYLQDKIAGQTVKQIKILDPYIIRGQEESALTIGLEGERLTSFNRRGKYILASTPGRKMLLIHLGMTGDVIVRSQSESSPRFTRAVFHLDGKVLFYTDQRKFGRLAFYNTDRLEQIPEINRLGPEPLDPEFKFNDFKEIIRSHGTDIHKVLILQDEIAGIGNIYADEICYRAGIRPDHPSDKLTEGQLHNLYKSMRQVLEEAVEHNADLSNEPERYLIPHRRTDRLCPGSATPLRSKRIGGRTSYWCPEVQH